MDADRLREMRQRVRAYLARDEDIIVPIKKWKRPSRRPAPSCPRTQARPTKAR
jgi:hypothetical protein